ncbi:unnamed protein product [Polarella glacialis]|uniref:Uncharacterized protein n=2 Tax=Polarella glacialis TaxID=89957 RepID=A0A813FJQ4_POLGL|nr:unnamed protein product [Polarella glacialis]|mmetsp:Transcript_10157/g.16235  ORF Transcript_10157/g.16235 Transcript_10157/m.16235 type:complete len:350 (-) Transcript_10157:79-1128(-)
MAENGQRPSKHALPVLNEQAFIERSKRARLKRNPEGHFIHAMYSSLVDGIVTDPELMVLPLDDHSIVRGHAVFDTATLSKGRVYRLEIHLDRLFKSAKDARLPLPFGPSEDENRAKMTEIVCQTCVASGKQHGNVRYWLSAGPGNFGFTVEGCEPAFYCVVCGQDDGFSRQVQVIDEWIIDHVPIKPPLLAQLKSNNYMLNVLTAMASQEKGGKFGLQLKADGTMGEGCVANCAIVTKDGGFITPVFSTILAGTTVRKALELAQAHLLDEAGADGKPLRYIAQKDITLEEVENAQELMMLCGDVKVLAVRSLNGKKIGNGDAGPVATALHKLVVDDAELGNDEHIALKY